MSLDLLVENLGGPRCVGCRRPGALACGTCLDDCSPAGTPVVPSLDRVTAAFDYDGVARSLVLELKLRGRRAAASILAAAICKRVWETGSEARHLVWIPGRRRDIRRRGFDHAHLIATHVSRNLGIPCSPALRRALEPNDQTGLGAVERRRNLAGAFTSGPVSGAVAVVDDVMTTGTTLSEAARTLREGGATAVEGLVCCAVE